MALRPNGNITDSPFAPRLPRDALANPDIKHAILQEGSLKPYERDLLDGVSNARGQVLHKEGIKTNTWISRLLASTNSGDLLTAGEFYRVRVRVELLHAMIPIPCNKAGAPNRGIIEMHPIFLCRREAIEGINAGDIVTVSFSKGPKYGDQRDGTIEAVFQKGSGNYETVTESGNSENICETLAEAFEGPRQSNPLGNELGVRTTPTGEAQQLSNATVQASVLYDNLYNGIGGPGLENRELCVAMVANAMGESNLSYEVAGDSGEDADNSDLSINIAKQPSFHSSGLCCSFGLWQYNVCGGLGRDLLQAYGLDSNSSVEEKMQVLNSYERQVEFMIKHVRSLINPATPYEIPAWVDWFVREVENPKHPESAIRTRTRYAHDLVAEGGHLADTGNNS